MIHPTAVIDTRAELAPDVRVGPYSIIGPDVTIGAGTEIGAHVVLEGRVRVGARARVGHGAIIGGVPQDFKFREGTPVGVSLGDDTAVREYVTIHRATREGDGTCLKPIACDSSRPTSPAIVPSIGTNRNATPPTT